MPEKPRSFYSRLFPGEWDGYPDKAMSELADWMAWEHKGTRPRRVPGSIPSGYVYFAQIVNHDLSHDHTKLSEAGKRVPEETENWRTPRLDLEILYGEGPTADKKLYDQNHPRGRGYLALGTTEPSCEKQSDNDLKRQGSGKDSGHAVIFDDRNDSTLLIAQLQVVLIKFHNRLLDDIRSGRVVGTSGGNGFAEARRLMTWHYQWIVRNDLLPKIVTPDVLNDITMHWPRLFRPKPGHVSIPVEFSLAAFQYGHSAVQNIYSINRDVGLCPQEHTMYLTGLARFVRPDSKDSPTSRLPERFVVELGRMFGWAPPGRSNFSAGIDTLIASGLYKVPGELSILFNNEVLSDTGLTLARGEIPTFKLPEATLRRAAAVGLPSGQEACSLADVPCLPADQLAYDRQIEAFFKKNGMLDRTPLFYYLMREAEVSGRATPGGWPGKRLGPLGSRIVAEVILGVISADADSYVHSEWQPPLIAGQRGESARRIDTLRKMAFYATGYKGKLV
jgi:hypothetical protein